MTAKINAVVRPNINIPDTASNGPSSFHRGGNTMSEPTVVCRVDGPESPEAVLRPPSERGSGAE